MTESKTADMILQGSETFEIGKLKPHFATSQNGDWFEYLERDCSVGEERLKDSNMTILRDTLTNDIVGFRVHNVSTVETHDMT